MNGNRLLANLLTVFSILLLCLHGRLAHSQPAQLLASYDFDAGAADSTGHSARIYLYNAPVTNSSLYLNGKYGLGDPDGYLAEASITGLSYNSFTVSVDFNAVDFADGHQTILTGGPLYRWFSLRHNTGKLEVTLNNQDETYVIADGALQTGRWQSVLCSVDIGGRKIVTFLNNSRVADVDLPVGFRLNIIGSPEENFQKTFYFANYSNADAFNGYVDNLKVWNRAMAASEIDRMLHNPTLSIQRAVIVSWPSYPSGYVLESSDVLAGPYEPFTGSIFSEASQSKAAVPLNSPRKFFRLNRP